MGTQNEISRAFLACCKRVQIIRFVYIYIYILALKRVNITQLGRIRIEHLASLTGQTLRVNISQDSSSRCFARKLYR